MLLRVLLLTTAAVLLYVVVFRPKAILSMGRKARIVAYAYVAAILISAVIRLTLGWGE